MATAVAEIMSVQGVTFHPCQREVQELGDVIADRRHSFHSIALRYLGNAADAEDAIQDAFLAAYTHLDQFKGEAQMATWLATIVINSARAIIRRRLRRVHIPLDQQDGEQDNHTFSVTLPDLRPGPEESCRRWELIELMARLCKQLSPDVRRTFQLREVDGLSIRETAQLLGVPDGTVKARASRARTYLKRLARESARRKRNMSSRPVI